MLKIVIEVPICHRCKSKAMRIAVSMNDVSSVSVESEKNKMVVTGNEVDPVKLTASLRKKFAYANILSVEEVKPEKKEEPEKPDPSKAYCRHEYPWHYIWPAAFDYSPSYCTYL